MFNFIFEEANSRGIGAIMAGEYIFRTLTGFDDLIDVLPFDTNRFAQESWSEEAMDEVTKKVKHNSGVNVFLFNITFDSISDYLGAII